MQQHRNEIAGNVRREPKTATIGIDDEARCDWDSPSSFVELNNSISLESRVYDAGLLLMKTMQLRASGLIRDRRGHLQVKNNFIKFLRNLVL
ncbi:unnamed protein product [Gongylonema pulchrum]|uniref:Uncharacterized protein n=1 Tax=Gongylonema pulchrum TaxID=637853 RepID=A0A183DJN3_9BILA|nr:unnamed protein product [Gongylonema pulchrum]